MGLALENYNTTSGRRPTVVGIKKGCVNVR